MEIYQDFRFEAAHFLPNVPDDHKCARTHGHSYFVRVLVSGPVDSKGWVMDFATIEDAFSPLHKMLDHHLLNDIVPNPTSENLAKWIWENLIGQMPGLKQIIVSETINCGCVYAGR